MNTLQNLANINSRRDKGVFVAKNGLYANIHAKRERIAAGSGERMRSPGEAGAPTASQFRQAARTAKAEEGMLIEPPEMADPPVKKIPPPVRSGGTTADSLFLYNQAKKIANFYDTNKNYVKDGEEKFNDYLNTIGTDYNNILSAANAHNLGNMASGIGILNKAFGTNFSKEQILEKFKNTGKYKTFPNLLMGGYDIYSNPAVPPIYLHPSIKPQFINKYNANKYGDIADVPMYDPIAIKPISTMTPEERLERERKYYPDGTPKPIQPQPPKAIFIPKKKPVPVKPEIIVPELLEPKDASYQLSNPEIAYDRKVKMRPVPIPAQKPPPALQYPAMNQSLLEKIKSFFTGKAPMPYWTDKQGEKHYPHLGESNAEDVKQIKMLKSGLNPLIPEDAAELRRINMLLKMGRKERLNNILKEIGDGY
jgi:hypothetical protein